MNQNAETSSVPLHPAPHRHRAHPAGLALGLLIGPVAWLAQTAVNYGFASHACFPAEEPFLLPLGSGGGLFTLNLAVNIAAIVLVFAAGAVAYRNWRATRRELEGHAYAVFEAGEGRTRFLALWGMLTSAVFAAALVFNLVAILGVPPCGYS